MTDVLTEQEKTVAQAVDSMCLRERGWTEVAIERVMLFPPSPFAVKIARVTLAAAQAAHVASAPCDTTSVVSHGSGPAGHKPPAKDTDHARTSPGPVNCLTRARFQTSMHLPRECARCGAGPCPFFNDDGTALRRDDT